MCVSKSHHSPLTWNVLLTLYSILELKDKFEARFGVFCLFPTQCEKHKYKPISNLSLVLALPYYTHFVVENKLTFNSLKVAKQEMELMPQGRQSPALCD